MGLNEFAGYLAVALSAWFTSYLAAGFGPRPVPFYLGIVFSGLGLLLSVFAIKETRLHAEHESQLASGTKRSDVVSFRQIFLFTSWKNRSLFARQPGRLGEQLERWNDVGAVAAVSDGTWTTVSRAGNCCRDLPGCLGNNSTADGSSQ